MKTILDKELKTLVKCMTRKITNDCRMKNKKVENMSVELYAHIDGKIEIEFFTFFVGKDFGIWETYSINKGMSFVSGNSIYR